MRSPGGPGPDVEAIGSSLAPEFSPMPPVAGESRAIRAEGAAANRLLGSIAPQAVILLRPVSEYAGAPWFPGVKPSRWTTNVEGRRIIRRYGPMDLGFN